MSDTFTAAQTAVETEVAIYSRFNRRRVDKALTDAIRHLRAAVARGTADEHMTDSILSALGAAKTARWFLRTPELDRDDFYDRQPEAARLRHHTPSPTPPGPDAA